MIDQDVIERTLGAALRTGAEFAEIYAEDKRSTSVGLDDGRIEQVTSGRDRGAGIRVIKGDTTGFAHTSDLSESGLAAAARAAAEAASRGDGGVRTVALTPAERRVVNPIAQAPDEVPKTAKVELLNRIDEAARAAGSEIVQVSAGYADSRKRVLIANSDGLLAGDDVTRVLTRISVVANGDTGMQTGFQSMGHTIGWEVFDDASTSRSWRATPPARRSSSSRPARRRRVRCRSSSRTAPAACCSTRRAGTGSRPTTSRRVPRCTPARSASWWPHRSSRSSTTARSSAEWGTLAIDDEGHPTQRNVLIEDGVLTDYMWDYLRSRKEGRQPSGNGRRQSYMHLPMVRMTNTFVLDGPDDPDDIVAATDHGVYVAELGGGSVNTATGDFVFGMREAYLIENGQITEPLREGNLIGNGPQVLRDIDMLGNDFAMGNPGTCGKDGQGVPVGDGQPTLRVKSLTIGGTAA